MTMPVTSRSAIALLLMLTTTGCSWFGRKPKAPRTPPAPVPVVTQSPPVQAQPDPQPPQPEPQPQPPPEPPAQQPQPPTPQPQPAQPVQTPKPKQAPKPAPPAFGQILTPQQQQDLGRSYQQSSAAARQVLTQMKGRALSRDQAETANRIRSFLLQADEARAKDPATAAQLAHRAEVLARDLQSTLH